MSADIRPYHQHDTDTIVRLSLLAWEPVFLSFEHVMGAAIYAQVYPDWKSGQRQVVERALADTERFSILVADDDGEIAGFIVYELNHDSKVGQIYLLAVHPDHQNHGIGTLLNLAALDAMRACGMELAAVGTGGDPGHAPARRSYEKAGFTQLPLVRYYKDLRGRPEPNPDLR
jgi:ribosomal protein S18 acetylase RimI-like enzyme